MVAEASVSCIAGVWCSVTTSTDRAALPRISSTVALQTIGMNTEPSPMLKCDLCSYLAIGIDKQRHKWFYIDLVGSPFKRKVLECRIKQACYKGF